MIDLLNQRVTAAILVAERLPEGEERRAAFHQVSLIEEELARAIPASELQGKLARRGAVTAALSACDWDRAIELAQHYQKESCLLRKAESAILSEHMQQLIDVAKAKGSLCPQ